MGVKKRKEDTSERTLADIQEARSPCSHCPGSDGKIRIIRIRLENKLPLYVLGDEEIPMHPRNQLHQKKRLVEDNVHECESDDSEDD